MTNTFTHNGNRFSFELVADDTCDAPWEREDGHGPVSDWTSRDKAPGELVLNKDRSSKRFYDFQAACELARKDGWGFLPGKLVTKQNSGGKFAAWVGTEDGSRAEFATFGHDDINAAIREVYALHKATFPSARAYAAAAAMRDFERLKDWCDDQWSYVGVVCHMIDDEGDKIEDLNASLWGIESDCDDYHQEVARELADDIASQFESRLSA